MNGLELARAFYKVCRPTLNEAMPNLLDKAAVGLVGEGSECFGCDDEISRDHDFGPAFCLWLPQEYLRDGLAQVEAAFALLPRHFDGMESRLVPERRLGRVGPLPVEGFYAVFTGLPHPPQTWRDWLRIPEHQIAACTNGEVFEDNGGLFSRWRSALQDFYPRDVLLKKMAARCMVMAQSGQYNLPRALQRGDSTAAMLAAARFSEAALSLVFLCNRRYTPFYKWAGKLAAALPVLGSRLAPTLRTLAETPLNPAHAAGINTAVEEFCGAVAAHLRAVGLSCAPGNWLWEHGPQIMSHVEEPELLHMDMLQG